LLVRVESAVSNAADEVLGMCPGPSSSYGGPRGRRRLCRSRKHGQGFPVDVSVVV